MGVKELIESLRTLPPFTGLLCDEIPLYERWLDEEAMNETELSHAKQNGDVSRHVHRKKGQILIHQGPKTMMVKIEDVMLALRNYRSKARHEGYQGTGKNFYNDFIQPFIEYGQTVNLDYVILVADKGSPREKEDTQREREEARKKSLKRKEELGESKVPDDALPPNIQIDDDGIELDTVTSIIVGHGPGAQTKNVRGRLPLDPTRVMSGSNRPLRIKLYEYLRKCMCKDKRFYRVVNGKKVYFGIIFDYDLKGPWRIRYNEETKQTVGEQLFRFRNNILEADLACFWWGTRYATQDVFIHAGDTDYIPIALMNAHRFKRSLLIQIRAHDRLKDPVCMEALEMRRLLHSRGVHVSEFALGCAMVGNDFVKKSWYLNGIGPRFVWQGIRLYHIMRDQLLGEFDQAEGSKQTTSTSQRQLQSELRRHLDTLVTKCSDILNTPRKSVTAEGGRWVYDCVFNEYSHALDAIVCCIYLASFCSSKSGQARVVKNASLAHFPSLNVIHPSQINSILAGYIRPIIESILVFRETARLKRQTQKLEAEQNGTLRDRKQNKRKRKPDESPDHVLPPSPLSSIPPPSPPTPKKSNRKPRAPMVLPNVLRHSNYVKALERIQFVLKYWGTLQSTAPAVWE